MLTQITTPTRKIRTPHAAGRQDSYPKGVTRVTLPSRGTDMRLWTWKVRNIVKLHAERFSERA